VMIILLLIHNKRNVLRQELGQDNRGPALENINYTGMTKHLKGSGRRGKFGKHQTCVGAHLQS